MNILASKQLTRTEEDLVASVLQTNPILRKYFEILAHNTAMELATCAIEFDEDPEEYIRKQFLTRGKLDLLATLAEACTVAPANLAQQ